MKVNTQRLRRQRDEIIALAQRLTDQQLAELARRVAEDQTFDSYPTTSSGGGSHTTNINRPTETAALAQYPDIADDGTTIQPGRHPDHDTQLIAVQRITQLLADAHRTLTDIERNRQLCAHITDGRSTRTAAADERAGAGACLACTTWCSGAEHDRLRSGFCNACRQAWRRWKDAGHPADRVLFIAGRQAELAGQHAAGITPIRHTEAPAPDQATA